MMRLPLIMPLVALLVVASTACDAEAGARRSRSLKTGQTACWDADGNQIDCAGTGQDGELQRGEPRAYLDLGNGTIRDRRTALMWEKLSDDGSIHDKDNTYTWEEAFAKIADLNAAAFGGFTDWRLPNGFELFSLVNLSGANPAVSVAFHTGCAPGCTVLTCSCTEGFPSFWSSSTYRPNLTAAVVVLFGQGQLIAEFKTESRQVRAVRAGS